MRNYGIRLVVTLLIPCLWVDPATASGMTLLFSAPTQTRLQTTPSFENQALAESAFMALHSYGRWGRTTVIQSLISARTFLFRHPWAIRATISADLAAKAFGIQVAFHRILSGVGMTIAIDSAVSMG